MVPIAVSSRCTDCPGAGHEPSVWPLARTGRGAWLFGVRRGSQPPISSFSFRISFTHETRQLGGQTCRDPDSTNLFDDDVAMRRASFVQPRGSRAQYTMLCSVAGSTHTHIFHCLNMHHCAQCHTRIRMARSHKPCKPRVHDRSCCAIASAMLRSRRACCGSRACAADRAPARVRCRSRLHSTHVTQHVSRARARLCRRRDLLLR